MGVGEKSATVRPGNVFFALNIPSDKLKHVWPKKSLVVGGELGKCNFEKKPRAGGRVGNSRDWNERNEGINERNEGTNEMKGLERTPVINNRSTSRSRD